KASWPPRSMEDHKKWAKAWKDAASPQEREKLFKAHGIRWSELLDLPYWNPIFFTIIDSMHTCYLGLFKTHCRRVWGIDVGIEGGDGTAIVMKKPIPRPSDADLMKWLAIIREGNDDLREVLSTKNCKKNILWHICNDNNLRRAGTKWQLAGEIAEW